MAAANMDVQWLDRIDDLRVLEDEWQALAERTRADVYLRPAWLLPWWRYFGQDRQLACLTLREGGQLAGLLPFVIERLWAGPLPLRLARLAGTDPHCMVFQVPLEPELAEFAWRTALSHLTDNLGCMAVSLTPVSDRATHLHILGAIGAGTPGLALHQVGEGEHIVFDLAGTFENWLTGLSGKRRKKLRYETGALRSRYAITEEAIIPSGTELVQFAELHGRQWRAAGRGGHFCDWPGSLAFYCDLADGPAKEPPVRLYGLTGSESVLAMQFTLVAAGRAHWRLPARVLDPKADRLSLGSVGLVRMIEALCAMGVDLVEGGRGHYDYKLACGGISVPVWRMVLYPDTRLGRLRLRWLLKWSDMLNLLYYRIWFLKLAPRVQRRLGLRSRPLWRNWIRSRV